MKNSLVKKVLFSVTGLTMVSAFAATPPKNLIGMEHAQVIALKAAPGSVKSSEVEFEKRQWVYSFDITGADSKIHEVLVNAKSGKVVSNTIESPAKEAAEAKADGK